jgi:hypothetical protein
LTFKIKINMRNDGHFGQFKIFSQKAFIIGWNVLRSMMFQVYFRKIYQIAIEKMNFYKSFYFLFLKSTKILPNYF